MEKRGSSLCKFVDTAARATAESRYLRRVPRCLPRGSHGRNGRLFRPTLPRSRVKFSKERQKAESPRWGVGQ